MYLTYTLFWFGLVVIAIVNGVVRDSRYAKHTSELRAHQISSVTGVTLFFVYTWILQYRWPIETSARALIIGGIWLGLTIAFEFTFGHFVLKHSWQRLLVDYNLVRGQIVVAGADLRVFDPVVG